MGLLELRILKLWASLGEVKLLAYGFTNHVPLVKGIQVIKPNLTLFIGMFKTFVQHGDQNLQIKLEMDSKERKAKRGNIWSEKRKH